MLIPDPGWHIATRAEADQPGMDVSYGDHGYDPIEPDMSALFLAHGPAFAPGARLPPTENLWDQGFTAMEIYNGYDLAGLRELFRGWLTLVGRGLRVTATAVSDTHKRLSSLAGGPRSDRSRLRNKPTNSSTAASIPSAGERS